jgi:hypothetical protein
VSSYHDATDKNEYLGHGRNSISEPLVAVREGERGRERLAGAEAVGNSLLSRCYQISGQT